MTRSAASLVITLGLALCFVATACRRSDVMTIVGLDPSQRAASFPLTVVDEITPDDRRQDAVTFRSARVVTHTLELEVSFGGGCRTHEFGMLSSRSFRESEPVQTDLVLLHRAHDDPCERAVLAQLTIDLTPLRDAWRDAYRLVSGAIVMTLEGFVTPLRYEF